MWQIKKKKKATVVYSSFHQKVETIFLPLESGLGHRTCFGQWDIRKHDWKGLQSICPLGLAFPHRWETLHHHVNKPRLTSYRRKDNVERSQSFSLQPPQLSPSHLSHLSCTIWGLEQPRSWFLNLASIDIWHEIILCRGRHSCALQGVQ